MNELDLEKENAELREAVRCLTASGRELMATWRLCDRDLNDKNYIELQNCRDRFELGLALYEGMT